MKHYIYISDTKINMLFTQVPPTFLESTSTYVRGSLKMKWGLYEQTGFVFFTGKQGKTIVGLGGSLVHVIGSEQVAPLTRSSWGSASVGMERSLSAELDISPFIARVEQDPDAHAGEDSNSGLGYLVGRANRLVDGSLATCEFVALRLAKSGFEDFNVVVGTPLYVAYAI